MWKCRRIVKSRGSAIDVPGRSVMVVVEWLRRVRSQLLVDQMDLVLFGPEGYWIVRLDRVLIVRCCACS